MTKALEHDDPFQLNAVEIPGGDLGIQARVIIEEYLRIGHTREDLLRLFDDPFYVGTYQLTRALGQQRIIDLINTVVNEHIQAIAQSKQALRRE